MDAVRINLALIRGIIAGRAEVAGENLAQRRQLAVLSEQETRPQPAFGCRDHTRDLTSSTGRSRTALRSGAGGGALRRPASRLAGCRRVFGRCRILCRGTLQHALEGA